MKYTKPVSEIEMFHAQDVITTSDNVEPGGGDGDLPPDFS